MKGASNMTTIEGRRRGLTDSMIRAAKPTPGRRLVLRDGGAYVGLELRVSERGIKSFSFLYRNSQRRRRRLTLGVYGEYEGELTLAAARRAFKRARGQAVDADPQAERMAARHGRTIGELFAACHAEVWAGKSCDRANKRLYARHITPAIVGDGWRVESMRASDLTEAHVYQILSAARRNASGRRVRGAKVNGHATRNRVLSLLSRMLRYARGKDYGVSGNVASNVDRLEEGKRDSYVRIDALGAWWRAVIALDNIDVRECLQLVILSAQRTRQIRYLDWSWIVDLDGEHPTIEFPRSAMKGKQPHVLGLPPLMLAILKERHARMGSPTRGPVFGNAKATDGVMPYTTLYDAHGALCRLAGFAEADKEKPGKVILTTSLHDWRRAFNNHSKRAGVSRFDRSRVLSHADPSMTVEAYEDGGYPLETARALEVWERILLTAAVGNKVVPLRPAIDGSS
jgi:hypothetical protein